MPPCQFSEDQFEDSLLWELLTRWGGAFPHFKPSRNVEATLGFDFAINVPFSLIRRSPIRGINLHALSYAPGVAINLPAYHVSSFVQCKVPFQVKARRGANPRQWERWKSPYYKFDIDKEQNKTLMDLERNTAGLALVRYAAPCFNTWTEYDQVRLFMSFFDRSHFQSPSRLNGHGTYTYQVPLGVGHAFSDPVEIAPSDFWRDVRDLLASRGQQTTTKYIEALWNRTLELSVKPKETELDRVRAENLLRYLHSIYRFEGVDLESHEYQTSILSRAYALTSYFQDLHLDWNIFVM